MNRTDPIFLIVWKETVKETTDRPDGLYWRWSYRAPVQFCPLEDIHFYPGDGPCVDGYFYWKTDKHAKRLDLLTWRTWGRKKSPPRQEHPRPDAFQESL